MVLRMAADVMTVPEVCALLGMDRRTVQRRAAAGELPYIRKLPGVNGRYLFDRTVVEMFARHGGARDKRRRLEAAS
jgi:excisionase family DNA binding protein